MHTDTHQCKHKGVLCWSQTCVGMGMECARPMDCWLLEFQLVVLALQLLSCTLCQLAWSGLARLGLPSRWGELCWESMPASMGAGSDSQ